MSNFWKHYKSENLWPNSEWTLTANAIEELLKCGNMWNLKHFSGMLTRHIQIVLVALISPQDFVLSVNPFPGVSVHVRAGPACFDMPCCRSELDLAG